MPRRNRSRHPPPTRRRQATIAIPPGRGVRCLLLRLTSPKVHGSKKISSFWIYKKPQLPARIWRYVFGKHVFGQQRGKAHSCGKRAFLWKVRIPLSGSSTAPLIAHPVGLVSPLRRLRRSSSVPIYIICPPVPFRCCEHIVRCRRRRQEQVIVAAGRQAPSLALCGESPGTRASCSIFCSRNSPRKTSARLGKSPARQQQSWPKSLLCYSV